MDPFREQIDPKLASLVTAPFSRVLYLQRVQSIVERYEGMIALDHERDPKKREAIVMRLLFRHPSAHLEHASIPKVLLPKRAEAARQELISLRAAAPLPAPPERTDRTFVLALADTEWLLRELIHIKRNARRRLPEILAAHYLDSGRIDPLPDVDTDRVRAIAMLPRGRFLRIASEIAGARHGIAHFRDLIAPRPTPRAEKSERTGRVRVCAASEIRERCAKTVEAFGRTVAVFRDHGRLKAIDDFCPHRGGPLGQGDLENGAVICPLHGWAFDLESGRMRGNPRVIVPTYEVTTEGDDVFLGPSKKRP
jgi:3-phenylpropionate/trans-cinnamate dioxygenase ferredoxin component